MNATRFEFLAAALVAVMGCSRETSQEQPPPLSSATPDASAPPPPWQRKKRSVAVPKGMVHIEAGALVAGTPPDLLPRVADEEMPGEQVVLEGFFIDVFAFPNEEGAIPLTNVSWPEARALCEREGKRLCSELEWERACKGPDNTVYEYGDRYRSDVCETGGPPKLLPSGLRIGCRSEFGVHDMHGGMWEWTDSPWGRTTKGDSIATRGGNSAVGEVVGRCANAEPRKPAAKSPVVGFRCCQGDRNPYEVTLQVERGAKLRRQHRVQRDQADRVRARMPDDVTATLFQPKTYRVTRIWDWRPVGNELLLVAAGCSGPQVRRTCGVSILRASGGASEWLGWAPSGFYLPTVQVGPDARDLWVYGGDSKTHFRRRVRYAWGSVTLGEIERNAR